MTRHGKILPHEELSRAITSEDLLGKDVIDAEGGFIGVTNTLYLDPDSLQVLGVSVDKGFLRKGLMIGAEYIREITPHAVFLSIRPAFEISGKSVFDPDGAKLGTVHRVVLAAGKNEIAELHVRPSRIKKSLIVPAELISRIEENVFLSISKDDFLERLRKEREGNGEREK